MIMGAWSSGVVLSTLAGMFATVGVGTFSYPPDKLWLPHLWAVVALCASSVFVACIRWPRRSLFVVGGSVGITTAVTRAVALVAQTVVEAEQRGYADHSVVSYIIAAAMWMTIAVLMHELWLRVVLPWSAISTP